MQTDADWNEQADIQAHIHETATADIIGRGGTPFDEDGFKIGSDLSIEAGRFYVDGILCENPGVNDGEPVDIVAQTDLDPDQVVLRPDGDTGPVNSADFDANSYVVFLQVWKRHLTALEDESIREIALGGPDTTTRLQVIWQVRLLEIAPAPDADGVVCIDELKPWQDLISEKSGKLRAKTKEGGAADEETPCLVPPSAGYRRLENQLYRVEVHEGATSRSQARFKWSRDNGSVVARWEAQDSVDKKKITVSTTGRDKVLNLAPGDFVELTDRDRELNGRPGVIVKIDDAEGVILTLNLLSQPVGDIDIAEFDAGTRMVRRWEGVLTVDTDDPVDLEDGVQIEIADGAFHTGDHWQIPARALVGIEWPPPGAEPNGFAAPVGIEYHHAPLAITVPDGRDLSRGR